MKSVFRKDQHIVAFLNSLIVEKGLSRNTIQSYESDIYQLYQWNISKNKKRITEIKKIDFSNTDLEKILVDVPIYERIDHRIAACIVGVPHN